MASDVRGDVGDSRGYSRVFAFVRGVHRVGWCINAKCIQQTGPECAVFFSWPKQCINLIAREWVEEIFYNNNVVWMVEKHEWLRDFFPLNQPLTGLCLDRR